MAFRGPWVLAALVFSLGCASAPKAALKPLGQAGSLGVEMCPAREGLSILRVGAGSPAEKAGLLAGDVLTGYRGQDLARAENRKALLWDVRNVPDNPLELAVTRSGKVVLLKAWPKPKSLFPMDVLSAALSDEILSGRSISVAVVVQVNHTRPEYFQNEQALKAWRSGTQAMLQNLFESMLLSGQRRCGNFSVVDRDKTRQVLDELHFQMTGAVAPETSREVGKMTGASHILFAALTRFQRGSSYEDTINARLVAVESDAVLANVQFGGPIAVLH